MRVAALSPPPDLKPEPLASDKILVGAPTTVPLTLDTSQKIPVTLPRTISSDAPEVAPSALPIPVSSSRTSPADAPEVVPSTAPELRLSPACNAPQVVPEAGLELASPASTTSSSSRRTASLKPDYTATEDTVLKGRFAQALAQRFSRSEDEIWFVDPNGRELFKCKDRWSTHGSVAWLDAKSRLLYTLYLGGRWAGIYDSSSRQVALLRWRQTAPGRNVDLKLYMGAGEDAINPAAPDMVLEARQAGRATASLKVGDDVVAVLNRIPSGKEALEVQIAAGVDSCMAAIMTATMSHVMREVDADLLRAACDAGYGRRGSLGKWFREHKRLT